MTKKFISIILCLCMVASMLAFADPAVLENTETPVESTEPAVAPAETEQPEETAAPEESPAPAADEVKPVGKLADKDEINFYKEAKVNEEDYKFVSKTVLALTEENEKDEEFAAKFAHYVVLTEDETAALAELKLTVDEQITVKVETENEDGSKTESEELWYKLAADDFTAKLGEYRYVLAADFVIEEVKETETVKDSAQEVNYELSLTAGKYDFYGFYDTADKDHKTLTVEEGKTVTVTVVEEIVSDGEAWIKIAAEGALEGLGNCVYMLRAALSAPAAEEAQPAVLSTELDNGMVVTVQGDIPNGAQPVAAPVDLSALAGEQEYMNAAYPVEEGMTRQFYAYDIGLEKDGVKVEPAEGGKVTVTLSGFPMNAKSIQVLHLVEKAAEPEAEETPAAEENAAPARKLFAKAPLMKAAAKPAAPVAKANYVMETVTLVGGEATFTVGSFSTFLFTVDFEFEGYKFSIAGESEILLSDLFKALNIGKNAADAVKVEFTDETLIAVEQLADGSDWKLTSLLPFDTEEKLTVTFASGEVLEIKVTDAVINDDTTGNKWDALWNMMNSARGELTIRLEVNVSHNQYSTKGALVVPSGAIITLNLNGHNINRNLDSATPNGYVIIVEKGGELIVRDGTGNVGRITGGFNKDAKGAAGGIENKGKLTLNSGVIRGNTTTGYGGGVRNVGTFIMNGGIIENNTAALGGGVRNGVDMNGSYDSFTMNGGTIQNNTATSHGGGISSDENPKFTMTGGIVQGNTATDNGGGIAIAGNGAIGGTAVIKNNIAGNDGGGIWFHNENKALTITAGSITNNTATTGLGGGIRLAGGTIRYQGGSLTNNKANGADGKGGGIAVTNGTVNMNVDPVTVSGNEAVWGGGIYATNSGSVLALNKGTVTGNSSGCGGGVYISAQAALTVGANFSITSNSATKTVAGTEGRSGSGGGIYIGGSNCSVTMNGTVSGNVSSVEGGGITVNKNNINLTAGSVTGNQSGNGGGIFIIGGSKGDASVYMNGVNVSQNIATNGGGVYVATQGTLGMSSQSIASNTAVNGGGVYVAANAGGFNMNGGSLSNNGASGSGGAVYNAGTYTITGGSLSGNTAATESAGVFQNGTMNLASAPVFPENQDVYLPTGRVITKIGAIADSVIVPVVLENEVRYRDILISAAGSGDDATGQVSDAELANLNVKLKSEKFRVVYNETGLDVAQTTPKNVIELDYNFAPIKVVKTGMSEGETALFKVTGNSESYDVLVIIGSDGSGEQVLNGLQVGTEYTVTEDESWTWRYELTGIKVDGESVSVAKVTPDDPENPVVAEFTNELDNNKWLDCEAMVRNEYGKEHAS